MEKRGLADKISGAISGVFNKGIDKGSEYGKIGLEYSKKGAKIGFEYSKEGVKKGYEYGKKGAIAGAGYTKEVIVPTTKKYAKIGLEKTKKGLEIGGGWVHDKVHTKYLAVTTKMQDVDERKVDWESQPDLKLINLRAARPSITALPLLQGDSATEVLFDEDGNMIECPVCCEELLNTVIQTKCGHEFHIQCILKWLTHSKDCPLCREGLDVDEGLRGTLEEANS